MHAIRCNSPGQMVARLCGKHSHSAPRAKDKAGKRAAKKALREFRIAISQVLWGPEREGREL